ncbi:acyl carrier protein [Adhaeribacter sp. BT258]|uniref:Acyl carrier protein n=1 Tax=Adhaeribacter terrigena TaxID=2793070 RepID=A0ABS1C1Z7_9BACT|nr:acyl carrier protein [Adhaeribacter terrigena]MBK0403349.1 acyl carrier protein [Adhaeribacter terrigena]
MLTHKTDRIATEVIRIISRTKALKPSHLRENSDLSRDFGFDNLDVVDVILEVEKKFHITIPDEVQLSTVGDFVRYVSSHTTRQFSWI